jgi:hypothetical protein
MMDFSPCRASLYSLNVSTKIVVESGVKSSTMKAFMSS